jgi:hypothetical protein
VVAAADAAAVVGAAAFVAAGAGVEVALPPQAASTAGMISERSANELMRRHDPSRDFGPVPMISS